MRTPVIVVMGVLAVGTGTAAADTVICDNPLSAPFTGTADDVIVPRGAVCHMDGANVDDVKVFGALRARRTIVRGDLQAKRGHDSVLMSGFAGVPSTVMGDVKIMGGVGPGAFSGLVGNVIHGDLEAKKNRVPLIFGGNVIGGDLQVFKNVGVFVEDGSSAIIGGNTVGGDLQCRKNRPAPGVSPTFGANIVEGDKEGQCSAADGF